MASAENIIGLTRDLLKEESNSDVPAVSNEFLYEAIMDGQSKWEDSFQIGGENAIKDQVETGFDLASDTTITADLAKTGVSFITDADQSSAAANGAMLIWDDNMPDFINYTTYVAATKTYTGVTGIAFAHEEDDTCQRLYKLPSNFGSFREAPLYGDGVRLNGIPLSYINTIPVPGFFSEYNDGTNRFLVLPKSSTGSASVLYNKTAATINSLDDVVSVPDKYKFFLTHHCAAYIYQGRADLLDAYNHQLSVSEKILMRALTNRNVGKKIRTRPFGRGYSDSVTVGGYTYPFGR